jgi:hypothetical protein
MRPFEHDFARSGLAGVGAPPLEVVVQESEGQKLELYAGRIGPLVKLGPLVGVSRSTTHRLKHALKVERRPGDRRLYVSVAEVYDRFGREVAERFDRHAKPVIVDHDGARRARDQALLLVRQARGHMETNSAPVCADETTGDESHEASPEPGPEAA